MNKHYNPEIRNANRKAMRESRKICYRSFIQARITDLQEYLDAIGLIPAVKALTGEQLRNTNDNGSKKRNK